MSNARPKVSCLVVTADRRRFLRRSLLAFQAQTYPHRELVVVDDGREPLDDLLAALPAGQVQYIRLEKEPENTLGRLRNISIEAAGGDYLTIWDDDDWYHPDRLSIQVSALQGRCDSCIMSSALIHIDSPEFFLHPFLARFPGGVPATLLFKNDRVPRYPELRRGEDAVFLKAWKSRPQARLDESSAHLQIRCHHGRNTWDRDHFVHRLTKTPRDAASYAWSKFVRRDLFRHRGFRLSARSREAFGLFLKDSRRVDLFPEEGRG